MNTNQKRTTDDTDTTGLGSAPPRVKLHCAADAIFYFTTKHTKLTESF